VLAIVGGGGAGRTTTALGLAAAATDEPIVVDLCGDLAAASGSGADSDPGRIAATGDRGPVSDAGRRPGVGERLGPASEKHGPEVTSGVDVFSGVDLLSEVDPLSESVRGERRVVLDCPAGAGGVTSRALAAADHAVVVATNCRPVLREAARAASLAGRVAAPVRAAVLTKTRVAPRRDRRLLGAPATETVPRAEPPVLSRPDVRVAYRAVDRYLPPTSAVPGRRGESDGGTATPDRDERPGKRG